jgi:uncharacterized protein YwlG (UPF0340 family)
MSIDDGLLGCCAMYVQIKPLLNRILSIERVKYKEDHLPFVRETAATHAASSALPAAYMHELQLVTVAFGDVKLDGGLSQ